MLGDEACSTADDARALADVAPREVLLAQLAGAIAAPMQQFAGLLQALPRNFAYGLKALIDQQGGVPRQPARAADEPARRDPRRRGADPSPTPRRAADARRRAPTHRAAATARDAGRDRRPKPNHTEES